MLRLATTSFAVATLLLLPAGADAAGCEVLRDPADRAACAAREQARTAARAEVQRRVATNVDAREAPAPGRSAAWERAVEESERVDPRELLDLRLLAAVGGLAWFALAVRARRRPRGSRSA